MNKKEELKKASLETLRLLTELEKIQREGAEIIASMDKAEIDAFIKDEENQKNDEQCRELISKIFGNA